MEAGRRGLARHKASGLFVILRGGPSATEPIDGCVLVSQTHNAAPDAYLKDPGTKGIPLREHLEIFAEAEHHILGAVMLAALAIDQGLHPGIGRIGLAHGDAGAERGRGVEILRLSKVERAARLLAG